MVRIKEPRRSLQPAARRAIMARPPPQPQQPSASGPDNSITVSMAPMDDEDEEEEEDDDEDDEEDDEDEEGEGEEQDADADEKSSSPQSAAAPELSASRSPKPGRPKSAQNGSRIAGKPRNAVNGSASAHKNGNVNEIKNGTGEEKVEPEVPQAQHQQQQLLQNQNQDDETEVEEVNGGGERRQRVVTIAPAPPLTYDSPLVDLDEIMIRQFREDIAAYKYDLEWCQEQLAEPNLTPQETRTFQLRTLDLGHQIRHCKHRIEQQELQMRQSGRVPRSSRPPNGTFAVASTRRSSANASAGSRQQQHAPAKRNYTKHKEPLLALKRPRESTDGGGMVPSKKAKTARNSSSSHQQAEEKQSPDDGSPDADDGGGGGDDGVALQRLGYWKCRLCTTAKFLLAGEGRTPAAPAKWPLKDVSKMITHFTEMHAEHAPTERCAELGAALDANRGPFEYWLRRTHSLDLGDGSMMDECIGDLHGGELPELLRRLSRAAAAFPRE